MKKLMFGIAGVMAVLSSANAADIASIKKACDASEKTVWVEATNTCVPRNPCTARDKAKYASYCIRAFKDVQTPTVEIAKNLSSDYLSLKTSDITTAFSEGDIKVESYLKKYLGYCERYEPTGEESSVVGQNYIACKTDADMYYVFEFDDTTNHELPGEAIKEKAKAAGVLCNAVGGSMSGNICEGVKYASTCNYMSLMLRTAYKDPDINTGYNEAQNSCMITFK